MKKILWLFLAIGLSAQSSYDPVYYWFWNKPLAPKTISNLTLWLDASIGLTISGGSVTAWADRSGNNNHFTQGTAANQPSYSASGLNGRPAITFDGSNDYLVSSTFSEYSSQVLTIFAVIKPVSNGKTSGSDIINKYHGAVSPFVSWGLEHAFPSSVNRVRASWGKTVGGFISLTDTGTVTLTSNYILSAVWDGTNVNAWKNSTSMGAAVSQGTIAYTSQEAYVGTWFGDITNNAFAGDIAEIIVYSKALSATERTIIENYLKAKYGL